MRPIIGELEEGLTGSGSRKDLETMFQLIYLTFTQPRPDPSLFGVMTTQMKARLADQRVTPEFAFGETLNSTLTQNHPRARRMTPEMVDQMSLDKSLAFYKDRFSDASDFTFVFVGSLDLPTLKPLVEQYLGALPSTRRKETWKDVGVKPAPASSRNASTGGSNPRAAPPSSLRSVPVRPAERSRSGDGRCARDPAPRKTAEDLGGTYTSRPPRATQSTRGRSSVLDRLGCSPDRTDELVKGVFEQIELLKSQGPTEKQVNDVKETFLRELETSNKQNGYLLNQIALRYQYSDDLASLFAMADYYNKVTPAVSRRRAEIPEHEQLREFTLFPNKP